MTTQTDILTTLTNSFTGSSPDSITRLKGDASNRAIYRIRYGQDTLIGVYGPDKAENAAFIGFGRTFAKLDIPVPEIYLTDDSGHAYLLKDLGDVTLFEHLNRQRDLHGGSFPYNELRPLYREAVAQLARFQLLGADSIDYSLCYQTREFNIEAWQFDHNYFITCFAKSLLPELTDLSHIESDLAHHRSLLKSADRSYFLYRDFQSRNIMLTDNGLHFIDFQSGRRGAASYDIASLLYDGRANLPQDFRNELLELHTKLLSSPPLQGRNGINSPHPPMRSRGGTKGGVSSFPPYALIRVLQALGTYGNLGIIQGKSEYLTAIPYGLKNALYLIDSDDRLKQLSTLSDLLSRIQDEKRWEKYEQQ